MRTYLVRDLRGLLTFRARPGKSGGAPLRRLKTAFGIFEEKSSFVTMLLSTWPWGEGRKSYILLLAGPVCVRIVPGHFFDDQ